MKIIETYKLFNESLKSKLKGPSEDDLKNKIGEEKYYIWKTFTDAINSFDEPFEVTMPNGLNRFYDYSKSFEVRFWWVRFELSYYDKQWTCNCSYSGHKEVNTSDNWDEIFNKIKIFIKNSFDEESKILKKEIKRYQNNLNDMEKDLLKLN